LLRARRYPAPARRAAGDLRSRLLGRLRGLLPVALVAAIALGGASAPEVREFRPLAVEAQIAEPSGTDASVRASAAVIGSSGAPNLRSSLGVGGGPDTTKGGTLDLEAGDAGGSGSLALTQEGPLPVFVQYVVQPGDTASQIAERFGIATDYIVWNNADVLANADALTIGAILQVPSIEGIIHSARVGDTVSDLAVQYDSTTQAIVDFEANGFAGDADNLQVGALILIPGGRIIAPVAVEGSPSGSSWVPPVEPPAASWAWPATGRLTNVFSPRHPLGIDISMVVNTPIAAASAGQVTFVGGNPCCSYGYHVIIQHPDGLETLYAHLSQIWVSSGQWVETGEVIAGSGNTGYSTGPHLHFEIRKNGVYQNPLTYLP